MVTRIESPRELKGGVWYRQYSVKDEQEAQQIAGEQTALLYQSHIIEALILFVEVSDVSSR